jgi:glycosyltransferase involved in cell wall biosynthesis
VKISAVIITFNEKDNIARAVESVLWADEVLVIDSHSTDETREIAASLGSRVIERDWPGFSEQKQFGTDAAANDWILSIDADEWISDDLREEIRTIARDGTDLIGYRIPRLTTYMGREIRHGGWFPDRQLRFFHRKHCRWNGRVIHESVEADDKLRIGRLRGLLFHKGADTAAEHEAMIRDRYAPMSARQMLIDGVRTSRWKAAIAGAATFFQTYVLRAGFLDGIPGIYVAYFAALNTLQKHLILNRLRQERSRR